jgi:hypothetical protein
VSGLPATQDLWINIHYSIGPNGEISESNLCVVSKDKCHSSHPSVKIEGPSRDPTVIDCKHMHGNICIHHAKFDACINCIWNFGVELDKGVDHFAKPITLQD